MTIGIYWLHQKSRDLAIYVGSSVNVERRIRNHLHRLMVGKHENQILNRTWNKYGEGDFEFMVLEETSIEALIEREQFWMDSLAPIANISIAAGHPTRGRHLSELEREKRSKALRGRRRDPEIGRKISASKKGATFTDEHRRKLSASHVGKAVSADQAAKISASLKGKHRPADVRKKISATLAGHSVSDETRRKISVNNGARRKPHEAP